MADANWKSSIGHARYTVSSRLDYHTLSHVCGLAVFYHICDKCFVEVEGHDESKSYSLHADITYGNISDAEVELLQQETEDLADAEIAGPQ